MNRKRLTKKQLYGYSYMKWDGVRKRLRMLYYGECSFCFDVKTHSETACRHCRIDKTLCNEYEEESLYSKINKTCRKFSDLVDKMCMELSRRYYDEEK